MAQRNNPPTFSVIGLGKLGSPLAAVIAHKGFDVIGVDSNSQMVEQINTGIAPVQEPGLDAMIAQAGGRLRATTDSAEAVLNTQVTSIIVPTPSRPDGTFSLDFVLDAARQTARALAQKDTYHLVIIVSTVMPGDTRKIVDEIERVSGKVCGPDFGVCYSPEFIALGSVIRDLLNPDMVLIGESDPTAGALCEETLLQLVDNQPQVRRMDFVNAELSKLAVNTYVTMKITYANMLARICEKMPEANADIVAEAIGSDSRIGPKYLKGAAAYGGPCFPRDNLAFVRAAEAAGATAPLAETTHAFNREQHGLLADLVTQSAEPGSTIAILGLTYKAGTPVVEESASLHLIRALAERDHRIVAHDPQGIANAMRELAGTEVTYARSAAEALRAARTVVIMTAWEEYRWIAAEDLNADRPVTIVDVWSILDAQQLPDTITIVRPGQMPAQAANRIAERGPRETAPATPAGSK